jgi:chlorobactene glucosyltransferase
MNPFLLAAPWLAFPLVVPFILRRRPRLRDYAPLGTQLPFVSVIVPARNEAINIGPCVGSLLESDYPHKEIIVVDDGSTDATCDIAHAMAERDANLMRVIEPGPLPANWIGKNWACWNGYQQARGDLLLFTDADTRHQAQLLPRAVAALEQTGAGLLTILPRQIMESFWERIVLPHIFLVITMRFVRTAAINRTRNPRDAIANGQFLLMSRSCYERIGTHEAVRSSVVDDLAIAQRVVAAGEQLLVAHAPEFLETRMYRSLPEIVEGWSKNLALGAKLAFPRPIATLMIWLAVVLGIVLWVAPPLLLLATFFLAELASIRAWAFIASLAALAGWFYVYLHMRAGLSGAFLYPLGALVASFLMARSAWRGRRVEWRGRSYRVPI